MEIKRSIKGVRPFILSLFLVLTLATNVSATQVSDKSESVEVVEDREDELMGTTKPSSFSRAALSIPAEGVYDTIKDTKNSAGVMIERRFYKSGKLTEKRTYTSTGSTDCRMRNKYLYYSDGATLERHRTYLNTGATCYNTNTKRYGTNKKLEWQLIYDGSKGYAKEGRYYDITAAYYTRIDYYTVGKKTIKHYWLGAAGNRVTHVANLNSAGTEWLKATYYYDYTNKKVKQIINYTGKTPNLRTNETYYGTTGIKEWYRTYDSAGDPYHLTYYQANGIKKQEVRYLKGTDIWNWDIKYQANGVDRESVRYRNEDNIYTRQLYYYATGSKLKYDILYDEEGIKTSAKVYDETTQKITAQEEYVYGVIDIVTYFELDGTTKRKVRYFKDGIHLRWDINYVNNEKESVKLYDNKNNYEYVDTFIYQDVDKKLDLELNEKKKESNDPTLSSIFNNEAFILYISKELGISRDSQIFTEDFKNIKTIRIEDGEKLADSYVELKSGETFVEEVYDNSDDEEDEVEKNNHEAEEITEAKTEFNSIEGIHYFMDLEELYINNSTVSSIPIDINSLVNLKIISITNSKITDIPKEISTLINLTNINLSNNLLTTTSDYFKNLNNLEEINLSGNNDLFFVSKDLINLHKNGNLNSVILNQEYLRLRGTDVENISDITNNVMIKQNDSEKLIIKDEININVYKEDKGLNYSEIIIPEFTRRITAINYDKIKYEVKYLNKDTEYKIKNKEEGEVIDEGILRNDSIKNASFEQNGTYIVLLTGDVENIDISQVMVVRLYDKSSVEVANDLAKSNNAYTQESEGQMIDDNTNVISMNASMDDTDTIISQTEKKSIEEQSQAYEKLEAVQEKYDIENIEGYAGAYFDNDNKINLLFQNSNNLTKSMFTKNSEISDSIIFKTADNSMDELETYKNKIQNNLLSELPSLIYINIKNNSIIIETDKNNINEVKKIIEDDNSKLNIEYKVVDSILADEPNAKTKLKAGTYIHGYDTKSKGYYNASIGYRAWKTCVYKKKNKKGTVIKSKRRCNGYTTAAHLELKTGASVWKNSTRSVSVGTANKKSKQTDTRFITLNTKNAYTPKLLRNEKTYHYVFSENKNNDILVEGMIVTKVYRSIYSNAKWVSGKLTSKSQPTYFEGYYLDKSKGGVQLTKGGKYYYPFNDTMEAKILSVGGDSGGPLVRLAQLKGYKSKKYHIIGTTMSSGNDGYSQFSKVSRSQSYLGIKAY